VNPTSKKNFRWFSQGRTKSLDYENTLPPVWYLIKQPENKNGSHLTVCKPSNVIGGKEQIRVGFFFLSWKGS